MVNYCPNKVFEEIDVVFVEPLYEQNVGFVARSMKNFCLKNLVLVNPRCDIGVDAIKYSMHARDIVENIKIKNSLKEIIDEHDFVACSTGKKGLSLVRRHIDPESLARQMVRFSGKKALVIGREDIGLTNDELKLCDVVVTIEANPEYPILNASHAAAILFYEIFKKSIKTTRRIERPKRSEIRAFLEYFENLGRILGYGDDRIERGKIMLRRLIGEGSMTKSDLRLLFGYIRKSYEIITACRANKSDLDVERTKI